MSIDIWPPIAPAELKIKKEESLVCEPHSRLSTAPRCVARNRIGSANTRLRAHEDMPPVQSTYYLRALNGGSRRLSTTSIGSLVLIDRAATSQARELEWILEETREFMKDLKHGLQDCYALLAPIDPGSTLVLTTPRAEKVKGHITRVGTRIVKGVSRGLGPADVTFQLTAITRPSISSSRPSPPRP